MYKFQIALNKLIINLEIYYDKRIILLINNRYYLEFNYKQFNKSKTKYVVMLRYKKVNKYKTI